MFACYRSKLFTDVYPDVNSFIQAQKSTGLIKISDDSLTSLYGLIYSQYGDRDVLADTDYQFNMQIASKIFKYGQAWETRVNIQNAITKLNEEDIREGTMVVTNSANTSGIRPTTPDELLNKIDAQGVNRYKKSKVEALESWKDTIETDVTTEFINRFEELFSAWPSGSPDDEYWIPKEWLGD